MIWFILIVYLLGLVVTGGLYVIGNAFGPDHAPLSSIIFYTVIWPITWTLALLIAGWRTLRDRNSNGRGSR